MKSQLALKQLVWFIFSRSFTWQVLYRFFVSSAGKFCCRERKSSHWISVHDFSVEKNLSVLFTLDFSRRMIEESKLLQWSKLKYAFKLLICLNGNPFDVWMCVSPIHVKRTILKCWCPQWTGLVHWSARWTSTFSHYWDSELCFSVLLRQKTVFFFTIFSSLVYGTRSRGHDIHMPTFGNRAFWFSNQVTTVQYCTWNISVLGKHLLQC